MDELDGATPPPMSFAIADVDGGVAVTIRGELDIGNVDSLAAAVAPIMEREPRRLILEVDELRFADSSAIALWVRWANLVGDLRVRGASPLLARVIEAMGLDNTLRSE